MKRDRLREDKAEIHNLDDLIDARSEHPSHDALEIDDFGEGSEIADAVDVDDALTFPHPKHKPDEHVLLMSTPNEIDMDEDWDAQDIQPSDYEHSYDEGTDAHLTDDQDETACEIIHDLGVVELSQVGDKPPLDMMPSRFEPDEESAA
jgi:hypothetical protein